jgi:hypothetical protein
MSSEEMGVRQLPESPDVANRVVAASVAGFFLLVLVAMAVLFVYLKNGAPAALRPPIERGFPEPRLQVAPRVDLLRLERAQREELSGYAWVDRANGLARIPIEQAMRAVVARGNSAYDPPDPPADANAGGTDGAGR